MPRDIKKIVIHCTDSQDSLDIGANEIREWHTMQPPKGNGWSDIGYHYIVRRDGTIELGRPVWNPGAHVKGHNKTSIGVVWVGRDAPSDVQETRLLWLTRALIDLYKLNALHDVFGHTELDPLKSCPNIDMVRFRGHLVFTPIALVPQDVKEIVKP